MLMIDMYSIILCVTMQLLIKESFGANWCQIDFPVAPIWWDPDQHVHFQMDMSILALTEDSVSGKLLGVDLEYENKSLLISVDI